jgi:hypothetical protein
VTSFIRMLSAFQSSGKFSRVFQNSDPSGTSGERGRAGDDVIDLL